MKIIACAFCGEDFESHNNARVHVHCRQAYIKKQDHERKKLPPARDKTIISPNDQAFWDLVRVPQKTKKRRCLKCRDMITSTGQYLCAECSYINARKSQTRIFI